MARRSRSDSSDALEQLQTLGDRLAGWVAANPVLVISVLTAVLLLAAGIGGYRAYQTNRLDEASAALAEVRWEYFQEMGIDPTGTQAAEEPANPEIARRVRETYIERFLEVAAQHDGTPAAALARLEAGDLLRDSDRSDEATGVWQQAAAKLPEDSPLRSLAFERIAVVHEEAGRWREAAEAHEAAGEVLDFPARYLALADAARSYANAGDDGRALALYERVQHEAPDLSLPAHTRTRLAELEARPERAAGPTATPPASESGAAETEPASSETASAEAAPSSE